MERNEVTDRETLIRGCRAESICHLSLSGIGACSRWDIVANDVVTMHQIAISQRWAREMMLK
jgi:hypothetical protein